MSIILSAKSLTKKYGEKTALDHFSLDIPQGSIYGLLGPNGAGKTTFIRMINQITVPDSGEIFLEGELLRPDHIQLIGYMPEERGLYKNMSIGDQCMYFARLKGLSSKEAKIQLEYWFEKLDIEKWWKKKISELSKGMAQKIQFVVTVLHNPKLLIFDEPFSGFDPVNANLIRDEILELKEKGATIIFSTHRMESVEELCDYVALINHSQKVLDGKIDAVRENYKEGKYYVEIEQPNWQKLEAIQNKFPISIVEKTEDKVKFYLTQNDSTHSNVILFEMADAGNVKSFYEIIPKMNEVFINAVK